MDISIGVIAYNNEDTIGSLLETILNQKTKVVNIKEIVVVSSGSIDKTNEIVKNFCEKNRKIKLVIQKRREGKYSAINEFLKVAKYNILVLESADTIPKNDAIENLCKPLNNKKIGIVASHPVPKKSNKNYLGYVVKLQWLLHHKISLEKPKFGELIAFRNLFKKIKNTAVDEEHIAMLIQNSGFKGVYAQNAIVYNFGPETVSDFLKQRRRIYCGHLELKKKNNYKTPTIGNFYMLKILLKEIKHSKVFPVTLAILLEGYGRVLGLYDYYTNKKHYIWEVVERTKK
ncbi:MAG: glycosyltransferase [Candidatus Thorarchaeota archaeon]